MELSVSRAVLLLVPSYVLWRVLRPFIVKSTLSNVPGPASNSWWKGNFHQVFDRHGWEFHRMLRETYASVVKLNMVFGSEQLYVSDPLALHHILIKDQYIYEETDTFTISNYLYFGTGLFATNGEHHKKQRKLLNPVFSLKHMRNLMPIFYPITHELRRVLSDKVRNGVEEMNVLEWISRAALDSIGRGGLGYDFDALDEDSTNKYGAAVKGLGPTSFKLILHRQILPWVMNIGTPAFRRKVLEWIPLEKVQTLCEIVDVMQDMSEEIYQKKKLALEMGDEVLVNQVAGGKDIMSVLLKANMEANEEDRLPESELLAQMSTFIFAGHDTTSNAVSLILHQLALHPEVQTKLRTEVRAARQAHGDLDHDTLMALPYLDAVCRETMRVFPPVCQLPRTTRRDVVLPLLWPIKSADGKSEIREIPLKKNTGVVVSILGANRCKQIWGEDAEEWKPERWLNPLPESVSKAHLPGVYSSMMTFSGGGRSCIGFKFAEVEMKIMLSILLETFAFAPGSKEIFWAMSFIQSPVIKGSTSLTPQLPLKVSFAE